MSGEPDEGKLRDEIRKGYDAERLLGDKLWTEAREAIKTRLEAEWLNSPMRDTEARERIWMMRRIAQLYEDHIRHFADTGKLAQKQLADFRERRSVMERLRQGIF